MVFCTVQIIGPALDSILKLILEIVDENLQQRSKRLIRLLIPIDEIIHLQHSDQGGLTDFLSILDVFSLKRSQSLGESILETILAEESLGEIADIKLLQPVDLLLCGNNVFG